MRSAASLLAALSLLIAAGAAAALIPSADGLTVHDTVLNVTWLANADLAKTQTFGAQCTNGDGTACINPDGSMSHTTAQTWINGMNAAVYLGHADWQLPPIPPSDLCGFECTDNPMGFSSTTSCT
jgi:hypothetical protein